MSRLPHEQRGAAVLRRLPSKAIVAEIGVLRGVMSEYMLGNSDIAELHMIDSWETTDRQPERYIATGDDHALHTDKSRVDSHRTEARERVRRFGSRASLIWERSVPASGMFGAASLDMVFLDADHSREGVAEDIRAWLPRIAPGGWIGGHDYANPDPRFRFGVTEAVDEWVAETGRTLELDDNYTWFVRV